METQNPISPSSSPTPPPPEQPDSKRLKTSTTTNSDDNNPTPTTTTNTNTDKKPRYKRRKVAILFAYCGVGYQGMQKNPGAKTIEGDLEEALYFANAVPETERGCPNRYDFARSARTDKGVSAVGQVVSGKFYIDPPGFVERLNNNLPAQFRVFGFKRVTASFSAKKFCDRRRYVYLLPVFALDGNAHCGDGKCLECLENGWKGFGSGFDGDAQSGISSNTLSAVGNLVNLDDLDNLDNGYGCKEAMNVKPVESAYLGKNCDDDSGSGGEIQLGITSNTLSAVDTLADLDNGSGCKEAMNVKPVESVDLGKNCDNNSGSGGEIKPDITSNDLSALPDADGKVEKLAYLDDGNACKEGLNSKPVIGEDLLEDSSGLGKNCENGGGLDAVNGIGDGEDGGVVKKNVSKYGEEERRRFNKILKQYEGTHNFHNFTTRTKAADPSANRYIISFSANTTVTVDGVEFVKCEVVGQSFMLHQIRKMIGVAVAIMRNCAPESLIETALQQDVNINVPTAPEVGLYLDECFFTSYNQKWRDTHEEVSMKAYADEAEEFKLKHIYSHIASTERKEGAVAVWLHSLNHRRYPDLGPKENSEADEVPRTQPE